MKVSNNDLGNYEASVYYFSKDDIRPEGIRKSLDTGMSKGNGLIQRSGHLLQQGNSDDGSRSMSKIPGCCGMLRSRFTFVTNWSSFTPSIEWPESIQQEVHLPLEVFKGWDGAILFKPNKDSTGVILYTNEVDETALTTNGPFRLLQDEKWASMFS